jgi:hypothetical protein
MLVEVQTIHITRHKRATKNLVPTVVQERKRDEEEKQEEQVESMTVALNNPEKQEVCLLEPDPILALGPFFLLSCCF